MLAAWLGVAAFVIAGASAAVGPTAAHQLHGRNASAEAARALVRAMAAYEGKTSNFAAGTRAFAFAESSAAREDASAAPVASGAVVAAPPAIAPIARPPLLAQRPLAGIVRKPRGGGLGLFATFGARLTASSAHALSSPSINVSIQNDSINLDGWPAGATITLDVGGTERSTTADLTGHAYADRNLTGRDIVPDMTITASDGTTTQSLTVAHVTFDTLDPATDVASGTAAPFASVGVGLNRGGVGLGGATTVADLNGNWSINFGAHGIDVLPYTSGGATVADGDGNYTTAEFLVPSLSASLTQDGVSLNQWPPNTSVTVTVNGTPFSVTTGGTGNAYLDRNHLGGRDLVPGTVVTASAGFVSKSLTLVDMSFDSLDATTNVAAGHAPPNSQGWVNLNRGGINLDSVGLAADSSGHWSADFSGVIDVQPGTTGGANVTDDDGDQTTAEFLVPTIDGSLTHDSVNLNDWPAGSTVSVTVGGATHNATVDSTGHAYLDSNTLGVDLVAGTTIDASGGGHSKSVTLVAVTFDSLDAATDVATGHAPPGSFLWVGLNGGSVGLGGVTTVADASGNWSADFSGVIDVQPGTTGGANVTDDDGDQTTAEFVVPTIDGSLKHNSVDLNDWPAGSTVSVTIGGATHSATVDSTGHAFLDSNTLGVDLVAGTTIDASGGGYSKSVTLVDVTFDSLDAATDVASGHAPPGSLVNVNLNRGSVGLGGLSTVADASGSWSVDFSGVIDVQPGMTGNANVSDDDDDQTTAEFVIGRISTSLTNDWVQLDDWPGGSTVNLDVGGTNLSVPVDSTGHAFVDRSVHGHDLVPGMVITATQGSVTKQLTLVNMSFDSLDPATNIATGTAPPGSQVNVGINEGPTNFGNKQTTADSSGNWQVDFTGRIDITAGMNGFANVNDDDNDSTGVDWNAPRLTASLTNNWVQLNGWRPGTAVALDVAGTNVSVTPDGSGNAFVDSSRYGQKDLVPGMVITATQGSVTKQLTLLNVSFDSLDPATNVAAGTAPPGSQVNVNINNGPAGLGNKSTTADSSGKWQVDFTGQIDITAGMNGSANVSDADGDQTTGEYFPPTAQLNVGENTFFQLQSPTADSVTTATSATANESFQASVHNFNQAPIPAPTISLDGETATLTPPYTGGFPLTVTAPGDLQNGQELDLNTFCCQGNAPNLVTPGAHPGFDASRLGVLSPDGSVLTETVSVTLRDTAYGGGNANVDIQVLPQNQGAPANGATFDTVDAVLPTLGDGEQVQNNYGPPGSFEWNISGAVVGKLYTLTVPIDLNGLPGSSFKPNVSIGTGHPGSQVQTTGSSASIHDADLGGNFTASSAGGATVAWNAQTFKGFGVDFQAQGLPQLQASINTNLSASPGDPSVDSFAATGTLAGQESWSGSICDFGGQSGFFGTVPAVEITLPDARHDLDPAPTYPLQAGPSSLSQGNCFNLPGLEPPSSPPASIGTSVTPTVDVSRSATPSDWTVPSGGGVMDVTVSVTPTQADQYLEVHIGAADENGDYWGTVDAANITLPSVDIFHDTGNGPPCPPCFNESTNAGDFDWWTPFAIPGQTYTFTVPIDVPVGGTYKPHVDITAAANAGSALPDVIGNSTTIEDDGLGGTLTFSAGQIVDWQRQQSVYTMVSLDSLAEPSTPPTSSTVDVAVVAPGGGPAAGAFVTACAGDAFGCRSATTDSNGNATITGATPAGTGLLHFTLAASTTAGVGYDGPFDLVPGGTASRTVTLVAPVPPPADVSITERGTTGDGIPVVSVHNPATLTATGCPNGSASYTITRGSVQLASGSMAESPPGSGDYLAGGVAPPSGDANGPATVTISIECGTNTQTISFDVVYSDPSGVVVDQNGNPVAGATVTLLSAPSADGSFTAVPNGSPVMSPSNRRNSDTTAADGTFGWDVVAGFYEVEATAPGCAPAKTAVLTVPPPVTGLVLTLDCNHDTTPPVVAVTGVASGADYLLGSVPAAGCHTTDALSGVATPASLTIHGGPTGIVTATCAGATDKAGNVAAPVSVSYVVATPLGSKNATCNGYYGGNGGGNVTVPAGAVCTLIPGTRVNGNLQVSGALSDQGAAIGGNLQATGGAWIVVNGGSVGGNLQVQSLTSAPAGGADALCNATIGGNVVVQSNGSGAPVDVGNLGACAGGNGLTIGGNLQVQSNGARVRVGGNTAHGNVIVQSNTGGGVLSANSAGGNCLLQSNKPPIVGSSNTAVGHQNSCNANS